ncbi:MAG: TIGR02221 family CRISPR-associated protein [Bacteroidales bacterium]|nr:TIGR02221 family CRISPR-associated protein [Bacteroidales bacterium]HPO65450.1 TIGR02221 family CRISPR-associated protein [Bacteroidales bacterium]
MHRKVFLSILGTGKYELTSYYFDDKSNGYKTRFIQEATIKHFCNNWDENDHIYFFLTNKARTQNWNHPAENGYDGLSEVIGKLNLKAKVDTKDLPDGNNEKELWQIFDIIYGVLQENDDLYIDITHAFRSLPMLLTVLLTYAKVLKQVTVRSITYGNYEARDENNLSPVIDLTALSSLQDWSLAANNFVSFGNADLLVELTNNEIKPILKETKGKDTTASLLREVGNNIQIFVKNILTVRGQSIYKGEQIDKIRKNIDEAKQANTQLPQLNPLLNQIDKKISHFKATESVDNFLAATEWCIRHGLYQQAYSILLEGVVSYICRAVNLSITDITNRELISSACYILQNETPENQWDAKCQNNRETVHNILQFLSDKKNLVKAIRTLSDSRNDFMHAGFRENPSNSKKLIENIHKYYEAIRQELKL